MKNNMCVKSLNMIRPVAFATGFLLPGNKKILHDKAKHKKQSMKTKHEEGAVSYGSVYL